MVTRATTTATNIVPGHWGLRLLPCPCPHQRAPPLALRRRRRARPPRVVEAVPRAAQRRRACATSVRRHLRTLWRRARALTALPAARRGAALRAPFAWSTRLIGTRARVRAAAAHLPRRRLRPRRESSRLLRRACPLRAPERVQRVAPRRCHLVAHRAAAHRHLTVPRPRPRRRRRTATGSREPAPPPRRRQTLAPCGGCSGTWSSSWFRGYRSGQQRGPTPTRARLTARTSPPSWMLRVCATSTARSLRFL